MHLRSRPLADNSQARSALNLEALTHNRLRSVYAHTTHEHVHALQLCRISNDLLCQLSEVAWCCYCSHCGCNEGQMHCLSTARENHRAQRALFTRWELQDKGMLLGFNFVGLGVWGFRVLDLRKGLSRKAASAVKPNPGPTLDLGWPAEGSL